MEIPSKELQFGIKQYSYENIFSEFDKNEIINFLNQNFFDIGHINQNAPKYQTPYEIKLFSYDIDPIKKIKNSFIESCYNFIEDTEKKDLINNNKYGIISWAYMNWKDSGTNSEIFHIHNSQNPDTLSGILYLNLPKVEKDYHLTTTEFNFGCSKFNLPASEFNWFIFPSNFGHSPGKCLSSEKRYVLSADIWF
jgi:hypothetical protein